MSTAASTIVTNGDQTDTIRDALADGKSYIDALRTRRFEPDAAQFHLAHLGASSTRTAPMTLSILKYFHSDPDACKRYLLRV